MKETNALISENAKKEIDKWVAKYPEGKQQSAVLRALMTVQEENGGWLTKELQDAVADYLDMPKIAVYECVSFYTMLDTKPVGRHKIFVCNSISCMLCGSESVIKHIEEFLGIKVGETTPDNKFTLRKMECLAACANAPMMMIDKEYHTDLTPEKIEKILLSYE